MNSLIFVALASAAVLSSAAPSGHGGTIIAGPSGVVTPYGAVGPLGSGLGHSWGHGGALVAAPGLGFGYGGHGAGLGLGLGYGGGAVGLGHHGVTVQGPHTVPAVIAGPSGKIVADGLYGVPSGHGYHGW